MWMLVRWQRPKAVTQHHKFGRVRHPCEHFRILLRVPVQEAHAHGAPPRMLPDARARRTTEVFLGQRDHGVSALPNAFTRRMSARNQLHCRSVHTR